MRDLHVGDCVFLVLTRLLPGAFPGSLPHQPGPTHVGTTIDKVVVCAYQRHKRLWCSLHSLRVLSTFRVEYCTLALPSIRELQHHYRSADNWKACSCLLWTDLPKRPPGPAQRSTEDGHAAGAVPAVGAGGPLVALSSLALSSVVATAAVDVATAGSILHGDLNQQHIL